MKTYAIRFLPGQDLKKELVTFVEENNIKAGFILTCVGSLVQATLRMAGAKVIKIYDDKYEILSLVGTLSPDGLHLHVALSDDQGHVIGGHLMEGCIINVTAENLVAPKIIGKGLSISPLVVFLSFFFWSWVLGGPGMLLAMPLTVLVIFILQGFEETQWLAAVAGSPAPSLTAVEASSPAVETD